MSDFQYIQSILDELMIEEFVAQDGHALGSAEDLSTSCTFLAYADLLSTTYSASTPETGYGTYIAQPLFRRAIEGHEDTLDEEEARKIIEQSILCLVSH
ncbi:hypothetical protein B0H11DRAFT_2259912 [Mycena galericulata]|nr:hypothetical protein B0H11DRAFT_2259912 [Mycena galericulata]